MNNTTFDVRDWSKRNAGFFGVVDVNKKIKFRHSSTINVKDYVIYFNLLLSTTFLDIYIRTIV